MNKSCALCRYLNLFGLPVSAQDNLLRIWSHEPPDQLVEDLDDALDVLELDRLFRRSEQGKGRSVGAILNVVASRGKQAASDQKLEELGLVLAVIELVA